MKSREVDDLTTIRGAQDGLNSHSQTRGGHHIDLAGKASSQGNAYTAIMPHDSLIFF